MQNICLNAQKVREPSTEESEINLFPHDTLIVIRIDLSRVNFGLDEFFSKHEGVIVWYHKVIQCSRDEDRVTL